MHPPAIGCLYTVPRPSMGRLLDDPLSYLQQGRSGSETRFLHSHILYGGDLYTHTVYFLCLYITYLVVQHNHERKNQRQVRWTISWQTDPRGQIHRTHTLSIRPLLDCRPPVLVVQVLVVVISTVSSGRRPHCRIRCVRNQILTPSKDLHSTTDQVHRTQLVFLDYHGPFENRWWSQIGRDHHRSWRCSIQTVPSALRSRLTVYLVNWPSFQTQRPSLNVQGGLRVCFAPIASSYQVGAKQPSVSNNSCANLESHVYTNSVSMLSAHSSEVITTWSTDPRIQIQSDMLLEALIGAVV